jgi:hypothetical protein
VEPRNAERTSRARGTATSRARRLRTAALALGTTVVVAASVLTPGAAGAAPDRSAIGAPDAVAVEQALRQAGAVSDVPQIVKTGPSIRSMPVDGDEAPPTASTSSIDLDTGLSVRSGAATVRVVPVTGKPRALSPSGLAVYADTDDSVLALSKASTGGNAGYALITGAAAPTEYRFAFTVDGAPATLRLAAGGGVEVLDSRGKAVNYVAPAWAKDATGAPVATSYSVEGAVLVQSVRHSGTVYPVVADPRLVCDGLWCTTELSRAETGALAANIFKPAGACAILGPGGPVCAVVLAAAWAQASIALATGQCIGFRVWQRNLVSFGHIAYVRCYA